MKTAVRLILLSVLFPLLTCAVRAQPAQQSENDARCKDARYKYDAVVSDKAHRTVEEQSRVQYDEGKKYLSVCGERDDNFTRSIKEMVADYDAARRCESETWPRYSARVAWNFTDKPARQKESYEAAKDYLRLCGRYDTRGTHRAMWVVESYEDALSPPTKPRSCDVDTQAELYRHFLDNYKGSPEQQSEAYKTAKAFMCRCAEYDDITLYVSTWMKKYDSPDYFYPNAEAATVARADTERPRCRCDEMRDELVSSLKEQDGHERSQRNHDAVKKFLNICGDISRPIDRFLSEWLTKYDRAVRDFEEKKRQDAEPAAKGPTNER